MSGEESTASASTDTHPSAAVAATSASGPASAPSPSAHPSAPSSPSNSAMASAIIASMSVGQHAQDTHMSNARVQHHHNRTHKTDSRPSHCARLLSQIRCANHRHTAITCVRCSGGGRLQGQGRQEGACELLNLPRTKPSEPIWLHNAKMLMPRRRSLEEQHRGSTTSSARDLSTGEERERGGGSEGARGVLDGNIQGAVYMCVCVVVVGILVVGYTPHIHEWYPMP